MRLYNDLAQQLQKHMNNIEISDYMLSKQRVYIIDNNMGFFTELQYTNTTLQVK